jgi:hypothetical protein
MMMRPSRRRFLEAGLGLAGVGLSRVTTLTRAVPPAVSIVADPRDRTASAGPARWAATELEHALTVRGVPVNRFESVAQAPAGDLCIIASGPDTAIGRDVLRRAGVRLEDTAEALALAPSKAAGKSMLLASGRDPRGLAYALLELADRVRHGADARAALTLLTPVAERPANAVRSITRLFTSDIEDKPWYNDREMWPE